jgi:hypothetical protein
MASEEYDMVFKEINEGRCISCGFLGKFDRYSGICHEAIPLDRYRGDFGCQGSGISTIPWCYRNKVEFKWDVNNLPNRAAFEKICDKLKEDIKQDRKCPAWYPWTEGCSPKEHFEEFKMLELEQRRQEFEQRMEKERKEFELILDNRNREERKRTDRVMIWLTIALIIFAAMQVYAALATINPNNWLFDWLR